MQRTNNNDGSDEWSRRAVDPLVAYEEAKAAECCADVDLTSAAPPSEELADELACVDLMHRVWPNGGHRPRSKNELPAKTLGDFRLIREIGRGGMGTVYEAEQLSMGRRVALKVLPFAALVQRKSLQRFHNEVRAAAALDHAHIVSIYSVGEEHGVHFYAMQLIRGQTLTELVEQLKASREGRGASSEQRQSEISSPPSPVTSPTSDTSPIAALTTWDSANPREYFRTAARLGIQAADALQHAHDLAVLHRDIKPSNLMLDSEGELYVTDFGLARIGTDADMTMTGDIIGTLRYMAPEQALAKRVVIDHRADIYSLGVTLYELLTLEPAFSETDRSELLKQIAFEEPPPPRKLERRIPSELETIVLKAMAKEPDERYQAAHNLAEDLRAFLENRPIKAKPASIGNRVLKWSRRHKSLVRTAGIAFVLLSVILAVSVAMIVRAHSRAISALNETSDLLYTSDMTVAFQTLEKGWSDEVQPILDRHLPTGGRPDRRGLEWHLLQKLVQKPGSTVLAGHKGPVTELAVFPDRRRLASVGEDGTLRIWDAQERKLLRTIHITDEKLDSVAISPCGRYVAAGSKVVYLCDLDDGELLSELLHSEHSIESLAFSMDSQNLAAGARYEEVCLISLESRVVKRVPCASRVESLEFVAGSPLLLVPNRRPRPGEPSPLGIVELWREDLSKLEQELDGSRPGRLGQVTIGRSSPCGRYIAAGDRYKSRMFLFQRASGRVLAETPVSRDRLTDLAYSPNGKAIAISYLDGRVEYFELQIDADGVPAINRRPRVFTAHPGEVRSVRFVDTDKFATCGTDGLIRLWDLPTEAGLDFDLSDSKMNGLELSPNGSRLLYVCPHEFLIADTHDGEVLFRSSQPEAKFYKPAWSPTGDKMAVCCDQSVSILAASGQTTCSISQGAHLEGVAFSPNGSLIAIIGVQHLQLCTTDKGQQIFGQSLPQPGYCVAFSHDGAQLAYGGQFGAVIVLDVPDGKPLLELANNSDAICLAFSHDDSMLAIGHRDGMIRIWDMQTGRQRFELVGHERSVNNIAFSPDGRTLLSSGGDGAIRLWSVDHGRSYGVLYRRFAPGSNEAGPRFSLSSNGRQLAVGYRSQQKDFPDVLLWNLKPAEN